jgi:hypothetical protein
VTGDTVVVAGIELTAADMERKRQRLLSVEARWIGRSDEEDEA